MSIGYACLTLGVPNTNLKTCRMENATDEKLQELIIHNLQALENIIDYNIKNNIKLFRISSDIIPFGSSPVNKLNWTDLFAEKFTALSKKVKEHGIRVSMHPGQYTVINSPRQDVVGRAIEDLNYHTKFLQAIGGDDTNKIVLHIGGIYKDKNKAMESFIHNYSRLSNDIKKHLVIENDDRSYTIEDVLEIGEKVGIPVIFDNLHHAINKSHCNKEDIYWINRCRRTWKSKDGKQKIHYSQQDPLKQAGGHSKTIGIKTFLEYYQEINGQDIDIMLEVKDKNLSAVKCINSVSEYKKIKLLEQEWAKYKYNVLEKSPNNYNTIRQLLKDKSQYPAIEFYQLIEETLEKEEEIGSAVNGALHVWGYFKNIASEKEKASLLKNIKAYEEGEVSLNKVKNLLKKLTKKYQEDYLLDSYYFII